ncbi:MAG TPA: guanine deaminase, partial [Candidatus Cloacimonetes bacterium]|nr:guanine deaminase [Candidatus Cloacimonadota bacterium]
MKTKKIIKGKLLTAISPNRVLYLDPGYLVISEDGVIEDVCKEIPKSGEYDQEFYDYSEK